MTRRRIVLVVALVAGLVAPAHAADTRWFSGVDSNNQAQYNLPAPATNAAPARKSDVAPGACIPKSSGANTLPLVCSTAGVDYENALTVTPPVCRVSNVLSICANGIGNPQIRQGAALSVMGNATNATANVADIPASGGSQFLATNAAGTALAFTSTIPLTSLYTTSVANVTALEALAGSGYRDGARVYVQTFASDFVMHTTSSATVDHLNVASVSGGSGSRWIRAPMPDGYWYSQAPFFVGGTGASDENNCTSTGTPCATYTEVWRRILGRRLNLGVSNSFTINIQGDLGDFDTLAVEMQPLARALNIAVTVIGTPTVTSLGTVSTATAKNYATADGAATITIPAFNWAPWVGKIIRKNGTTGTSSLTAIVTHDLGSGKARITQTNNNTVAAADLTTGDVIEGLTLPKVQGGRVSFQGTVFYQFLDFDPSTFVASFITGPGAMQFAACSFKGSSSGGWTDAGGSGVFVHGSVFSTRTFATIGNLSVDRSAFINANVTVSNGRVGRNEWQDSIFVGTSSLTLGEGTYLRFHSLGVYDKPAAGVAIDMTEGAFATFTDNVYGTGNNATSIAFNLRGKNSVALNGGTSSILADVGVIATIQTSVATIAVGSLPYYLDTYGNSITGAQNVDLPKHFAVAGADITNVAGAGSSVTAIHETSGPTQLVIGAIANGALTKRSGGTLIGATSGTDYAPAGTYITSLTTDVVATGPGAAAATIQANAVTLPKIVNFVTDSFPCRDTAGTGNLEVCAVGGGLRFTGGPGIEVDAFTGDATKTAGGTVLTLATVGGGAGSCTNCSVTFDAKGRQTAYSSGTAPVTSVSGTAARISSTGGTTPVLDLIATAVTPGSYTNTNLTVDAYGRITAAANGSAGGSGITQLTGDGTAGPGSGSQAFTLVNIPSATTMAGRVLATGIAAPVTPGTGVGAIYFDLTSKNLVVKDDTNTNKHGVQTKAAVTSNFVTAISDAGVVSVAQPAYSDISGAPADLSAMHFVTDRSEASLSNETNIGSLTTGLLKISVSSGIATFSTGVAGADFQVPVTFSTGLTGTTTVTANLSTGVSGGQTLTFGTGAGDNGTIRSTSNATKGKILFGTSAYDEVNNRLGIRTTSPSYPFEVTETASGGSTVRIDNSTSGGSIYFSKGATDLGRVGSNGPWLGSGSTDLMVGAYSGKKVEVYANGSATTSAVFETNGTTTITSLAGTGTRIATASSAGNLGSITIPSGNRVVAGNSGGTGFVASDEIRLDDSTDQFMVSDGGSVTWRDLSGGSMIGATNYSQVRAFFSAHEFHVTSESGGTGIDRNMFVEAGTANLHMTGDFVYATATSDLTLQGTGNVNVFTVSGQPALSVIGSGVGQARVYVTPGNTIASAASAVLDAFEVGDETVTITGSTTVSTATGFNQSTFKAPKYSTAATIGSAATVAIAGPPSIVSGGGALSATYPLWVESGVARFDGNGSGTVFEVPGSGVANSSATQGRIPILITGVGLKYLRYFND